jgi:hypothetical protein
MAEKEESTKKEQTIEQKYEELQKKYDELKRDYMQFLEVIDGSGFQLQGFAKNKKAEINLKDR